MNGAVPLVCGTLGVLVLAGAVAVAALYNRLVVLRNRVDNAWAQIEVQLKRRYDLIPNLVEAVKGYMAHESRTLEAVIAARNGAMSAQGGIAAQGEAENMLTGALRQLFAVAEAYPDLKADQGVADLRDKLTDAENKIAYARQFYNDTVMSFNTATQTFPANLLAGAFGFAGREYFEAEPAADEAPQVRL